MLHLLWERRSLVLNKHVIPLLKTRHRKSVIQNVWVSLAKESSLLQMSLMLLYRFWRGAWRRFPCASLKLTEGRIKVKGGSWRGPWGFKALRQLTVYWCACKTTVNQSGKLLLDKLQAGKRWQCNWYWTASSHWMWTMVAVTCFLCLQVQAHSENNSLERIWIGFRN